MEGKTDMTDFAVGFRLVELIDKIEFFDNILKSVLIKCVHKVKIDIIGLKSFKLFVKQAVEILLTLHFPCRTFRGNMYFVTIRL